MGRWRKASIGTMAATAIGLGIFGVTPTVAKAACTVSQHRNQDQHQDQEHHDNQHAGKQINLFSTLCTNDMIAAYGDKHQNAERGKHCNQHAYQHDNNEHVNLQMASHVNLHLNQHTSVHLNEHCKIHVNLHENHHINDHLSVHVNKHVNLHVNEHSNKHTQIHRTEHLNLKTNEHVHVQMDQQENNLLLALQSLHCDRSDYLYAYFENADLTETQVRNVSACTDEIVKLCGNSQDLSTMSVTERQELWDLFVKTFHSCGLNVSVHDHSGYAVNLIETHIKTTVYVAISDDAGHKLCTIPLVNSASPTTFVATTKSIQKASSASTRLSQSDISNTTTTGKLPQTATDDPLLIAVGLLLAALGGTSLVVGLRLSRRS